METFSREYLQSIPELNRQLEVKHNLENIVNQIKRGVLMSANEGKFTYLHPTQRKGMPVAFAKNHPTNDQILEALREKFIGCDIDYIEVKLTNGAIAEAGFKIDWS